MVIPHFSMISEGPEFGSQVTITDTNRSTNNYLATTRTVRDEDSSFSEDEDAINAVAIDEDGTQMPPIAIKVTYRGNIIPMQQSNQRNHNSFYSSAKQRVEELENDPILAKMGYNRQHSNSVKEQPKQFSDKL